ncbi:hypothetical protein AKJ37_06515, partial [candidate division MSBL1 archaeon SCGC-AAA259I09]
CFVPRTLRTISFQMSFLALVIGYISSFCSERLEEETMSDTRIEGLEERIFAEYRAGWTCPTKWVTFTKKNRVRGREES